MSSYKEERDRKLNAYLNATIREGVSDVIYDIETYPNCFTVCFLDVKSEKVVVFEISNRKNELERIKKVFENFRKMKRRLVGFNNLGFDYPVMHKIITENISDAKTIYDFAQKVIQSSYHKGGNLNSNYNVYFLDHLVPQIDLYKINHYDNTAKSTSLKTIQFNNRSKTIKDLPFDFKKPLTSDEIDFLIEYNKHDVVKTLEFYNQCLGMIKFRETLTKENNDDFMNYNDTKIGKEFFIKKLEAAQPQSCYKYVDGKRVINQTPRINIPLKECIFDYVKYDRPEFEAVRKFFENRVIVETKGSMSDLLESELGDVAKYANMKTVTLKGKKLTNEIERLGGEHNLIRQYPMGWWEDEQLKTKTSRVFKYRIAETLNVVINGFQYDFGTGGIHGSKRKTRFKKGEGFIIIDIDVSSFYPNLAIANNIYPQHLGELFCKIYKWMYNERKKYDKKDPINAALKLALNGSYGDSNNKYSPFYDPMFTMKITVNGQLSLCMLAEKLLNLQDLEMIQVNTDGVTVYCREEDEDEVYKICKEWERITKLELEYVKYEAMYIADVNNYVAIKENKEEKRKGRYEYENLPHHKNHSCLVVPMAVSAEIRGDCTVEEFIRNHKDIYDFQLRAKVPRSGELKIYTDEDGWVKEQNVSRYYVSKEGGTLYKILPALEGFDEFDEWENLQTGEVERLKKDQKFKTYKKLEEKGLMKYLGRIKEPKKEREFELCKDYKVVITNDMDKDFKGFDSIDYDYYIKRANDLKEGILDVEDESDDQEVENEE